MNIPAADRTAADVDRLARALTAMDGAYVLRLGPV